MKKDFVYSIIRGALFLLIAVALAYILWSIKNVVYTLTQDYLRVIVVVFAYASVIPLYWQYATFAVKKKDTLLLSLTAGAGGITLIIGAAFVLVDYSMNLFNTFDSIDTRLRSTISVSIWIVCAVLLASTFVLAIAFKKTYPRTEAPTGIVINELVTSVFCIWGNAWGTADAVYTLTQDTFSAVGMALTLDFLIFVTGAWYIAANDSATEKLTLFISGIGLFITSLMQVLDGYLRGGGVQVESEMKNISQFGFPIILLLSVVALVTTAFVDYWNGGFSFVKNETNDKDYVKPAVAMRSMQDQNSRSTQGQPNMNRRPDRPPMNSNPPRGGSSQGGGQSKREYAEPGGLPRPLVDRLKELGVSNDEIARMTLQQARAEVARLGAEGKSGMASPNGAKPPEPAEQNFN